MPLFEFICPQCGDISEQLVSGAHKPECPNCGSIKLEKQLSAFTPASSSSRSAVVPPCGSGACPTRGQGCAGGGCPFSG